MRFDDLYVISFIGVLGLIVLLLSTPSHASVTTTYYNQYGNTVVENTYDNNNGTVTSTYYNQYGNTTIGNTYNQD